MGQRYRFGTVAMKGNGVKFTDHFAEFFHRYQLADRQFANRQDQVGFKQIDFRLQPVCAIIDFKRTRYAVATLWIFARKTAANRREVNPLASFILTPTQGRLEPFEKRLARRPRKGPSQFRLLIARRLTDKHDPTGYGSSDDDRQIHLWTKRAGPQTSQMPGYFKDRWSHGI